MKQTFKMVFSVLLFSMMSLTGFAQNAGERTAITGKVVDKDGLGIIGLNVIEKGTKHAVLTDVDGNYKIQVPKGAVLQFSYIGMKTQERAVGAATTINITMQEDASTLDEVIVVGYGTQKKNNLTGAVATIKPDDIRDLPVTNLAESLRGQIAGLSVGGNGARRPGETADLQIRQVFSYSKDGSTSFPLIVIDDMVQIDPETGKSTMEMFNRLDPSEIESITVLKDGSAAIYGTRASQGAIIVKTKRGKEGKAKLSYSSQFAVNDAISHVKTMSAYENGIYNNRLWGAQGQTDPKYFFSDTELDEMKNLDYDWLKKAWKPATQQKHTLTVSGGTDKATYFAGINYLTQGANLGEQDYKKWNFRTGVNAKVTKDLDLSFSVSGNTNEIEKSFTKSASSVRNGFASAVTNAEQADYGFLLHMPKYVPWETTIDGENYYVSPFPRTDRNLGGTQNTNSSIAGWNYFALLDSGSKQTSSDFTMNVNTSLTYNVPFVKGLSLKGTYARTQFSNHTNQVALPFELARIKNFNAADRHLASGTASAADWDIRDNVRQSRVVYDNTTSKNVQANFFATYARTFGDHSFDAMVGLERSEANFNFERLYYENPSKDYLGTSATAGTLTTNSFSDRRESGTLSYMGRFNYSFKDKYLFQFIFREDASTKFAPENYWAFFPSVQAGWVISKENWFADNVKWMDYLKVRYSIGKTGKDNINPWRWDTYYDVIVDKGLQFGSNGGKLGGAIAPRVNPNRNVGWDTDWKYDLGIDMTLLNNRLSITADYYVDKNTDMLFPVSDAIGVPISVGGGFAEENFISVTAWGTEFAVNWKDKINDNFSYNVGIITGFSNSEIKKYTDQPFSHPSNNAAMVGRQGIVPVWGFKTWKDTSTGDGILRTDEDVANYWQYLTNNANAAGGTPNFLGITKEADLRKGMLAYRDLGGAFDTATGIQAPTDGRIDKNLDYGKLAKSNRNYGFTTNLGMKYKNFFMKTQISTSWGGFKEIDNVAQYTSTNDAIWSRESFWTDMYGPDNVDGKYPNLIFRDQLSVPSDFWSVNTLRCTVRNLTLGFDFPKEVISQLGISNASLGLTGYNLWDLYNPYPDHYRNMYDDSLTGYPTLRTWTLNLNVSF